MKKAIKTTIAILFAISVLISCCFLPTLSTNNAYAGLLSMDVWSKDMYESGFKGVSYSGNVEIKESKIYFGEKSSSKAQAISQYKLYNMTGKIRKCGFTAGLTINIEQFGNMQNNALGLAFGLQYSSTKIASKNTVFVYVKKSSDTLVLGVNAYDNKGTATEVVSPLAIEQLFVRENEDAFRLGVIVDETGGIKVLIDDFLLTEKPDANLNFAGYIGVGQTESDYETDEDDIIPNLWSVENFTVTGVSNNIPKTTDVAEDFDNNEFNTNLLYTYAYINYADDCYLTTVDNKLEFKNVSSAFMSTRYPYSNYEMTFDLCDIQREPEYDSEFNVLKPVSNKIGIALYSSDYDKHTNKGIFLELRPDGWTNTSPAENTKAVVVKDGVELYSEVLPTRFNLWDKNYSGKVFNVKITLTDGVIALYIKPTTQTGYEQAFTYDLGGAGQGYVKIYASGTSKAMQILSDFSESLASSFTIDNFTICNNDYDASADAIVGYASSRVPSFKHYDYVNSWDIGDLLFGGK